MNIEVKEKRRLNIGVGEEKDYKEFRSRGKEKAGIEVGSLVLGR